MNIDNEELLDIAQRGYISEEKVEPERSQPPKKAILDTFNPIVNNTITHANQYPWGVLHNDFPFEVKLDNITYPSVSHAIYSEVLCDSIKKRMLSETENADEMKRVAASFYNECISDMTYISLVNAYKQFLATYTNMTRDLLNMNKIIFVDFNDKNLGFVDNVIGKVIMSILRTYNVSFNPIESIMLNANNPLLGLITLNNVTIDDMVFPNIFSYVFYRRFLFFTNNSQDAYSYVIQNKGDIIATDNSLHVQYLEKKISEITRKANTEKFNILHNKRLLISTDMLIEDKGFLGTYATPFTNNVLTEIRMKRTTIPYEIIDESNDILQNRALRGWIQKRLEHVIETIHLIFKIYIKTPRIISPALEIMFESFFPQCIHMDNKYIVEAFPSAFMFMIQSDSKLSKSIWTDLVAQDNGGMYNIYLIWNYISMLVHDLKKVSSDKASYVNTITQYQKNVPSDFTDMDVYTCVRNILLGIKNVSKFYNSSFDVTDKEINLVMKLLAIDIPIRETSQNVRMLSEIKNDIEDNLLISSRDSMASARKIFNAFKTIHSNVDMLSNISKSRIYYFS